MVNQSALFKTDKAGKYAVLGLKLKRNRKMNFKEVTCKCKSLLLPNSAKYGRILQWILYLG